MSLAYDPTGGAAAILQLVLSCLVPLVVAHTAFMVGGRGLALLALVLASLHVGFIHCTGFFLSETFFQFAIAVAIWTSVAVLLWDEQAQLFAPWAAGAPFRPASRRLACGFVAGVTWGVATSFRPNALPVAVIVGAGLAIHWWRARHRRSLSLLAGGAVGIAVILVPLARRCAALQGPGFCPVSSNFAMNVAMGQLDDAVGMDFHDPQRPELDTGWDPPALIQHGYSGHVRVPFTMFDTASIVDWVGARIWQDPERAVLRAARNVIDLFRVEAWPPDYGRIPAATYQIAGWAFWLAAVLPGLIGFRRMGRRALRELRDPSGPARASPLPLFFSLILVAVMAVAAGSLGEARYRYPFDGALIILAGLVWCRRAGFEPGFRLASSSSSFGDRGRWLGAALAVVAVSGVAVGVLIGIVSQPAAAPFELLRASAEATRGAGAPIARSAADFQTPIPAHSAWNAPGNHVFRCEPDCGPLILRLARPATARAIEVSVDDNDRYRVLFYRDGVVRAHADLPRAEGWSGMRVVPISAPAAASAGYDAIGVVPLYGDGSYAFGHLRLLDD
jgi:hypothetical protein